MTYRPAPPAVHDKKEYFSVSQRSHQTSMCPERSARPQACQLGVVANLCMRCEDAGACDTSCKPHTSDSVQAASNGRLSTPVASRGSRMQHAQQCCACHAASGTVWVGWSTGNGTITPNLQKPYYPNATIYAPQVILTAFLLCARHHL